MVKEDFIEITEDYFIKSCEAAPWKYDVYKLKKAKVSERRPDGEKFDDVAYGCSLSRAIEIILNCTLGEKATNLKELLEELHKTYKEIKEKFED